MPTWNVARAPAGRGGSVLNEPSDGLSAVEKFFFMNPLRDVYQRAKQPEGQGILENLLREMRIDVRVTPQDLARIPKTGPAVVVANHPFGILDGATLGAIMLRLRPDVKMLTNYVIGAIPELAPLCIYLDPFGKPSSQRINVSGLRQAVSHLRCGGMLLIFPAGEVSHWQFRHGEVTDPDWSPAAARLVRLTGAKTVPVLFEGRNSIRFQLLGVVHPKLRTISLPKEFLNKAGKEVELRIGNPIPGEKIARFVNEDQAINYLRWRTYLLRRRTASETASSLSLPAVKAAMKTTVSVTARNRIEAELRDLGSAGELDENRDFKVFVAGAGQIPHTMAEIGRQRELAFREVGEGTGHEVDLDRFDAHYKQLILWHKQDAQIAGGYRFVNTDEVLRTRGPQGLYTTTLFWIDPKFFAQTGPALEVGRSFIRRDYQKHFASLLMMWRGLTRYVSLHPETPVLFGPVSISRDYNDTSRQLVCQYFKAQNANPLSKWIKPKRPFQSGHISGWELDAIKHLLDLEEMSSSIAEIESDGKGLPVLLRQYLRLGGELLAFNVDRAFSDALDGLILVDIRKTEPSRLEIYMGKSALASFLAYHEGLRTRTPEMNGSNFF
jgi:putative hemolysin